MASDSDSSTERGRSRRRRGLRVLAVLLLAGSFAAAGGLYVRVADPERVRLAAEEYLRHYVVGSVRIGAAEFSWRDGVRLLNLAVGPAQPDGGVPRAGSSRDGSPPGRSVFTCREIRLRHEPLAAFLGELRIRSVTAIEPTLDILRAGGSDRTNLAGLFRPLRSPFQATFDPLPSVELRDARVVLHTLDGTDERLAGEIAFSARALPSDEASSRYDVVWRSGGADGHSRFDLRTGEPSHLSGGLPAMPIELAMLAVGARFDGAAALADRLGLSGVVVVKDYALPLSGTTRHERFVTIDLNNVIAAIPMDEDEQRLAPAGRYLRFDGVGGEVRVTQAEIRASLAGRLRGSACTLALAVRPGEDGVFTSLADAAVDGRLTVRHGALPRSDDADAQSEAHFIRRFGSLAELYAEAHPQGHADLDLEFTKAAGSRERWEVTHAKATLEGVEASIRSVPARLTEASAVVEYDGRGVSIRDGRARRGRTLVSFDGRFDAPTRSAAKRFTVRAEAVRLTDELWASVPPEFRAQRERFFPEGTIDLTVDLDQPAGMPDAPSAWSAKARAQLHDVSITLAEFPYPLTGLSGKIEIEAERAVLRGVHGRAGDGEVHIDGEAAFDAAGPTALNLALSGRDLVFDARLLAAMPPATRAFVEPFHPAGAFGVEAKLSLDPSTRAFRHESVVTLNGMSMDYARFPVPLTDMLGRLAVTPEQVLVEGVTGRYREAKFSIDGTIARDSELGGTVLQIHGRGITLDEALRGALPPRVRDGLSDWTIEGPLTADTVLSSRTSGERGLAIRTSAKLDGGRVTHPFFPVPFERVVAEVEVDETGFRANGITAIYGAAEVRANVQVEPAGAGAAGLVVVSATGMALDESVQGLGRGRLADEWDRLQPAGVVDVHVNELRFGPPGASGRSAWTVSGYADFREVAFAGVADVKRATGSVLFTGTARDDQGGTSLSGRLALTKAELLGQGVTQTDGEWSFARRADGEGVLALRHGQGRIYGGSWTTQTDIHFGHDKTEYDLTTALHRVQIEPLLSAETAASLADAGPVEVEGLASGHVRLSGVLGDPATRRGSGRFEITEGSMYRLPLILAILNVLQLSVPDKDAFDTARADFLVDGNRIQLDGIRLEGKAISLTGTGTMNWPDRGVDLALISTASAGWRRVPLLTDFLEGAAGEIVQLQVTGPIYQPNVKARTLRGVADEVKRLFQKKEPKPIRPSP